MNPHALPGNLFTRQPGLERTYRSAARGTCSGPSLGLVQGNAQAPTKQDHFRVVGYPEVWNSRTQCESRASWKLTGAKPTSQVPQLYMPHCFCIEEFVAFSIHLGHGTTLGPND